MCSYTCRSLSISFHVFDALMTPPLQFQSDILESLSLEDEGPRSPEEDDERVELVEATEVEVVASPCAPFVITARNLFPTISSLEVLLVEDMTVTCDLKISPNFLVTFESRAVCMFCFFFTSLYITYTHPYSPPPDQYPHPSLLSFTLISSFFSPL